MADGAGVDPRAPRMAVRTDRLSQTLGELALGLARGCGIPFRLLALGRATTRAVVLARVEPGREIGIAPSATHKDHRAECQKKCQRQRRTTPPWISKISALT